MPDHLEHRPDAGEGREPDLLVALRKIRYELTALQARVSDALTLAAALNLPAPERVTCDRCGASFKGSRALAEHAYLQHEGPEPAHWLEAEALAIDDAAAGGRTEG